MGSKFSKFDLHHKIIVEIYLPTMVFWLTKIEKTDDFGWKTLDPSQENLFCAFALARVAAAMRVDHMERALGLFDLAKKKIQDGEFGGGLESESKRDGDDGDTRFLFNDSDRSWREITSFILNIYCFFGDEIHEISGISKMYLT